MDIFLITYDEPNKEDTWRQVSSQIPHAQRVDGIKGFNSAYKKCAQLSKTNRFFTIDGDNRLIENLSKIQISDNLINSSYILSWSAKNSINGLTYGNGGVKNWPRSLALKMRSHEDAESNSDTTDFCYQYNYYQMPEVLSISEIHHTPYQAFRAGFREGLKMSLDRGQKISGNVSEIINISNLERLKIWCSIGRDQRNGQWAIYGARLGCQMCNLENFPINLISDYQWFNNFWKEEVEPQFFNPSFQKEVLETNITDIGLNLNKHLNLDLAHFTDETSKFFKAVYQSRPRHGTMYQEL